MIVLVNIIACTPDNLVEIDLGRSNPDKILNYYFGVYQQSNPFESGLLIKKGSKFFIDKNKAASLVELEDLSDSYSDGSLSWEELKAFLESSYYLVTNAPDNLSELRKQDGPKFKLNLHGVMSEAKRNIELDLPALQDAILSYKTNGERIIYPVGTTFIADHNDDQENLMESTVMQKLGSGKWAYWVYNEKGRLVSSTASKPRRLTSPTQCIGCHFGQKEFEPDASFPDLLPERRKRKRQIYIDPALRLREPAKQLDEHSKRSDHVLGVYATIYLAQLRLKSESELSEVEKRVLGSISF